LHPSESIPQPSHRPTKKSGDPYYLKNEPSNHTSSKTSRDTEDSKSKTKSSEHKHKSHKKHKKNKSSKTANENDEIDLLEAEPPSDIVNMNGGGVDSLSHLEEPDAETESKPSDFVNDLLEELDPVKAGNNNNDDSTKLQSEKDLPTEVMSPPDFADLLAGGELKFKKRLELPNETDMNLSKV